MLSPQDSLIEITDKLNRYFLQKLGTKKIKKIEYTGKVITVYFARDTYKQFRTKEQMIINFSRIYNFSCEYLTVTSEFKTSKEPQVKRKKSFEDKYKILLDAAINGELSSDYVIEKINNDFLNIKNEDKQTGAGKVSNLKHILLLYIEKKPHSAIIDELIGKLKLY